MKANSSLKAAATALVLAGSFVSPLAQAAPLSIPFEAVRHMEQPKKAASCKAKIVPPVKDLDLFSIYDQDDDSRSTINPAQKAKYDKAIGPSRDFLTEITKTASNFTESDGKRLEQADCALQTLTVWAKADALSVMKTRQSSLSSARLIAGTAMAYMQVRPAAAVLGVDTDVIDQWLTRRAQALIPIYTETGKTRSNFQNHRYWGGFAVAAVGVAVGNKDFLKFGIDSYKIGICQVTADGALPLELARKKKARDYHIHAIAPLVMIASLSDANGDNLFGECDNSLQRLVHFALGSISDPSKIEALTGAKQIPLPMRDGVVRGDRLAWLDVYLHYFPEDRAKYGKLIKEPLFSSNLGGRVTVIYDPTKRN